VKVTDERRPPFSWASNDAIGLMVDALSGRELSGCLCVYQGLTYLASTRHDGDHAGFDATRIEIASICGLSTRRLGQYLDKLCDLDLLGVDDGGGSRPSTWQLVSPPPQLIRPDETSYRTKRRIGTKRPGRVDETSGRSKKERQEAKEAPPIVPPAEFSGWLDRHSEVTGHGPPRRGTKAWESLEASYRARRGEGYSADDLAVAILGAHRDDYRRENGYDVAESILRPTKVLALINRGRAAQRRPGRKRGELVEAA
jgi:hypothetical protein